MLDKKEVEKILAEIMDTIPEIEGIIAASASGKVVAGQTLTEKDHAKIAASVASFYKNSQLVNQAVDQGETQVLYIETDKGYTMSAHTPQAFVVATAGKDAAPSLGLIIRSLRSAAEKISKG